MTPHLGDLRRVRPVLDRALRGFAAKQLRLEELVNQVFWAGVRHGRRAAADDLEAWEKRQRRRDFEQLIASLRDEVLRSAVEWPGA